VELHILKGLAKARCPGTKKAAGCLPRTLIYLEKTIN
jgi:hypothetical protein